MSRTRSSRALSLLLLATLWAVVLLVGGAPAAHAGGYCDQPVTDGRTVLVVAEKNCFTPSVVRVALGQQITFTNRDDMDHTVTGVGHHWNGDLPMGRSVTVSFSEPGTYPYFCHLHLGMIGAIVVGNGVATANSSLLSTVTMATVPMPMPVAATTTASTIAPPARPAGLSGAPAAATRVAAAPPARSSRGGPYVPAAVAVAGLLTLGVVVVRRRSRTPGPSAL